MSNWTLNECSKIYLKNPSHCWERHKNPREIAFLPHAVDNIDCRHELHDVDCFKFASSPCFPSRTERGSYHGVSLKQTCLLPEPFLSFCVNILRHCVCRTELWCGQDNGKIAVWNLSSSRQDLQILVHPPQPLSSSHPGARIGSASSLQSIDSGTSTSSSYSSINHNNSSNVDVIFITTASSSVWSYIYPGLLTVYF